MWAGERPQTVWTTGVIQLPRKGRVKSIRVARPALVHLAKRGDTGYGRPRIRLPSGVTRESDQGGSVTTSTLASPTPGSSSSLRWTWAEI